MNKLSSVEDLREGGAIEPLDKPIEWLDVVDHNNEVVGRAPRGDVHRLGHRHRSVHILLFNSQGEVFLQRRSYSKQANPGLWDSSAAGHVDSGETYLECAARELQEELGVRPGQERFEEIGRMPATEDNGFEFVRVYQTYSDDPLTLEPGEIIDGVWVSADELEAWQRDAPDELTDTFRHIWTHFALAT